MLADPLGPSRRQRLCSRRSKIGAGGVNRTRVPVHEKRAKAPGLPPPACDDPLDFLPHLDPPVRHGKPQLHDDDDAPLFANQSRRRISKRRVQFAWATWQRRAGFDRVYGFHALRHTSVTNVYRTTHDLFLAQRFARHMSPLTTTV